MFVLSAFKTHLEKVCVLFVGQAIVNLCQVFKDCWDYDTATAMKSRDSLKHVTSINHPSGEFDRRWTSMQRSSADLPLLVDLWIDTRIRLLLYSRDKPVPLSALVRENKVTKHKIRHDYKNPSGVPGEDLRSGTLVETVQLKAFLSMFRHLQTIQYVTPGWPRNTTSVFPLYLLLSRTGTVPLVPTHTHKWFSATSGLHASHH